MTTDPMSVSQSHRRALESGQRGGHREAMRGTGSGDGRGRRGESRKDRIAEGGEGWEEARDVELIIARPEGSIHCPTSLSRPGRTQDAGRGQEEGRCRMEEFRFVIRRAAGRRGGRGKRHNRERTGSSQLDPPQRHSLPQGIACAGRLIVKDCNGLRATELPLLPKREQACLSRLAQSIPCCSRLAVRSHCSRSSINHSGSAGS